MKSNADSQGFWDSRRCPDCTWLIAHELWCPQLHGTTGEGASK